MCFRIFADANVHRTRYFQNKSILLHRYLPHNLNIESGKIVQNLRGRVSFVTMFEGIVQLILLFIFADNGRSYPGADMENN